MTTKVEETDQLELDLGAADGAPLGTGDEDDDDDEIFGSLVGSGMEDLLGDDMDMEELLRSVAELGRSSGSNRPLTPSNLESIETLSSPSSSTVSSSSQASISRADGPHCVEDVKRMELEAIGNFKMLWDPEKEAASASSQQIGGLLSPTLLMGVTRSLRAPSVKQDLGTPKCLAVSCSHYAIGTSHGFALIFGPSEQLSTILGADVTSFGAVCCIDIWGEPSAQTVTGGSATSPWVACGYANGHVVIWDYSSGAKIKTIDDAHSAAIVHLKFMHEHKTLLSADTSGTVYQFSVSSLLFMHVVSTAKILNGAAGPVFSLQPLPRALGHRTSDLDFLHIVAFSTKKRTLIVSLYPRVKILATIPAPASLPQHTLPSIAWLRRSLDTPILSVAWSKTVQSFQVAMKDPDAALSTSDSAESSLALLPQIELKVTPIGQPFAAVDHITGAIWLASEKQSLLLCHTARDEFRLVDPVGHEELDCFSAKPLGLVYHTRFAATETPIPALCSYYSSFCGAPNKIYILGLEGLFSAHLMSWRERISTLTDSGKWLDALTLASAFYEGRVGASSGELTAPFKEELAEVIETLLSSYVQFVLSPSKSRSDLRRFRLLGSMCIDLCQRIGRTYSLFTQIFQKFIEHDHQALFLELLEPYILNNRLSHLSPEVMQAFVVHYSASPDMLRRVERCIVRLDIPSLDFDQVIRLAIRHNLSTALIYMYNSGLEDYITPLQLLLPDLTIKPGHKATPEARTNGYKLLLYLNFLLRGRSYPIGAMIPDRRLHIIKKDVLEWVFAVSDSFQPVQAPYSRYANLHALLQFDCPEFLTQVLRVAFVDPVLPVRVLDGAGRQGMTEILVSVIVEPPRTTATRAAASSWPFDDSHATLLYTFLAPFLCQGVVALPQKTIYDAVYLLTTFPLDISAGATASIERQSLIVELLESQHANPHFDLDRLLSKAQTASFNRVTKYIFLRKGLPEKAVVAQLTDPLSCGEVFGFIASLVRDPSIPPNKANDVKTVVLSSLPSLINVNADKTCRLILTEFTREHEQVISSLRAFPKLEYQFLQSLVGSNDALQHPEEGGDAPKRVGDAVPEMPVVSMRPEEVERYVELLCKYDPLAVHRFLATHENYRLEKCLDICRTSNLNSATAYLHERMGDLSAALKLILIELEGLLNRLQSSYKAAFEYYVEKNGPPSSMQAAQWSTLLDFTFGPEKDVSNAVAEASSLCRRNVYRLDEHDYEALWFGLMDKLVIPLRRQKLVGSRDATVSPVVDKIKQSLLGYIRRVLEDMMGNVRLTAILDKIVRDHGRDEFGDFKPIILSMLDTYSYEKNILETANHLLQADAHSDTIELLGLRTQAFVPLEIVCLSCQQPFSHVPANPQQSHPRGGSSLPAASIFRCGHGFHVSCLGKSRKCPLCHKPDELPPAVAEAPALQMPESSDAPASTKSASRDLSFHLKRLDKFNRSQIQPSRLALLRSLG